VKLKKKTQLLTNFHFFKNKQPRTIFFQDKKFQEIIVSKNLPDPKKNCFEIPGLSSLEGYHRPDLGGHPSQ